MPSGETVTLIRDDGYIQLRRSHRPVDYAMLFQRPVARNTQAPTDPLDRDTFAQLASLDDLGLSIVSAYRQGELLQDFASHVMTPLLLFLSTVFVSLVFYRSASRSQARYEADLVYQATHDELTDMPNRTLVNDRLTVEIEHARRQQRRLGVACLDLDNFKWINDSFGHKAGDSVLQAVASRLSAVLRDIDSLGRMGSDEFLILMSELRSVREAEILAQRIRSAFAQPFDLPNGKFFVSASIGVAVYPDDADSASEMLSRADVALYRAKGEGRDRVCFFEERFNWEIERRVVLEQGLRQARQRGELHVLYPPKIDSRNGRWVSAEA